jgi:hypothetical protein
LGVALYLVSKGIPWDVVFALDSVELTAFQIIFGQQQGGIWEWDNMRWRPNEYK